MNDLYTYKAKVVKVIDGDTFDLSVDLGFTVKVNIRIRLNGVDTPEIHGVKKGSEEYIEGMGIKEEMKEKLLNKEVYIKSYKTGKYGRWLADIWLDIEDESINEYLINQGYVYN